MKKTQLLFVMIVAVLALPGMAALGQAAPPPIGDITKPPSFLYYLVATVLLGVTVLVSIMPAKRREQG